MGQNAEILNLIYMQYIFFGPLFVIVLGLSKLISKEKLTVNYFYSFSYLFMGFAMFQIASYSTRAYPYYWLVSYYMIPVSIVSPLFLYLRFRFLIQGKMMRLPVPMLFGLVAVPLFIFTGPLILHSSFFVRSNIELRPLIDPSFSALPLYYRIVHLINFLSKIILCSGLLLLIIRARFLWGHTKKEGIMLARISYIFTILMFITSVLLLAGDLIDFAFSRAAIAMVNSVTLCVFFASQYDPSYYGIFKHVKKRKKYEISKIKGINVSLITERLNRIMTEQELFKDETVSLKTLADMIDIHEQQLSEILNSSMNKSFSTFINDYKIAEAKKLLSGNPEYQVTRIALMVGFNSARTFNRVFRNYTGITPLKYRKKNSVHR